MHVLVVTPSFPSAHDPFKGSFIKEQVRFLRRNVERLTVLAPVSWLPGAAITRKYRSRKAIPEDWYDTDLGCRVIRPRYLRLPSSLGHGVAPRAFSRLIDAVLDKYSTLHPVDVIHAHYPACAGWAAVKVGRRRNVPVAITYHGFDVNEVIVNRLPGWKESAEAARMASVNLPVSKALMEALVKSVPLAAPSRVRLLGVDTEAYRPGKASREPTALFVGAVQGEKGVFDLLRAWVRVSAQIPRARLVIAGPDDSRGAAAKLSRGLGLLCSVEFTGYLPPTEIQERMRRAMLLCLPSYLEGTPVSIMEAMSTGLAVVATRVGGIPDMVSHGVSGLLVEPGDEVGLSQALCTVLTDPARAASMGREAQAFALIHFDADRCAKATVDVYKALLRPGALRVVPAEEQE